LAFQQFYVPVDGIAKPVYEFASLPFSVNAAANHSCHVAFLHLG